MRAAVVLYVHSLFLTDSGVNRVDVFVFSATGGIIVRETRPFYILLASPCFSDRTIECERKGREREACLSFRFPRE